MVEVDISVTLKGVTAPNNLAHRDRKPHLKFFLRQLVLLAAMPVRLNGRLVWITLLETIPADVMK